MPIHCKPVARPLARGPRPGFHVSFLASNRKVLLLHDGELKDVRQVIEGLGAQVSDNIGPDAPAHWDLAMATPRYLQAIASVTGDSRFRRVAVVDDESRTLRTLIRRTGIQIVVRRPIHPAALRLLIVHCLYRGPERRKPRVAAGAPVNFFYPWSRGSGVIAELSAEGCRLMVDEPLEEGTYLLLELPDPEGKGAPVAVPARVLRLGAGEGPAAYSTGIKFFWLTGGAKKRIRAAMESYQRSPAVLPRDFPLDPPAFDVGEPVIDGDTTTPNRRGEPRIAYEQRVTAHDRDASRVLIGRDLSVGGIRVGPHPELKIGQTMRVGVHGGSGDEPMSLRARVFRDDGERGVVLRFIETPMAAQEQLRKLVNGIPRIEETTEEGEEEIVLTEILLEEEV